MSPLHAGAFVEAAGPPRCEVSSRRCRRNGAKLRLLIAAGARRDERRPGSGGGGGRRQFDAPQRLVGSGPSQAAPEARRPDTVYTVRLSTAMQRGAALSDPAAGVLLCLVAGDGTALVHRVPRVNDPEITEQEVRNICSSIDEEGAGANCAVALHAAAKQRMSGVGPRLRFQEGAVDEVSFCAPELGPLAALIVGPEQGRWACEEVDVSSSRTGHTDRFVCREALGEGGAEAAAYLRPVPPGAVVYGSGDAAVVVSKAQAAQLYRLNMAQYRQLKAQLVAATAVLVGLGSGLAYAAGGRDLALPFALGGASGVLYQYMLQAAVDGVGSGAAGYEDSGAGGLRLALGNPAVRVALAAGALLGALALLPLLGGDGDQTAGSAPSVFRVQQIAASLVGFLCYKAAVVGVAIIPPPVDERGAQLAPDGSSRRADSSRE
ncbi:hypothetical protein ABPG75_001720 [Micractinium tetrahymenae]